MSLAGEPPKEISKKQRIAVFIGVGGLFILALALLNVNFPNKALFLSLAIGLIAVGTILFSNSMYLGKHAGIKNDGVYFKSMSSRGVLGWVTGIVLTLFYVVLYWFPQYLGLNAEGANTGLIALFDPLSKLISGNPASQWFVYGTLYTVAILIFGYKFILKYRHNRYEQVRTVSVMFFQLAFAFLIPEILVRLNQPYYDFKNVWPLNYDLFAGYKISEFLSAGGVGLAMLIFGVLSIFVITPILTYKFGKRWYCSWVCGCGGLAETAGDPYRQLSDKRESAWKVERWVIHSVVVFVTVMTIAVVYSFLAGAESSSINQYSQLQDKVVIMSETGGKPIIDRVAAAGEAGAKAVVFVNKTNEEITLPDSETANIDYIVVDESQNTEALKNIEQGKGGILINAEGGDNMEIAANQEYQEFDNIWLTKEAFLIAVILLLSAVFTWVMVYRRKRLAKDAKTGAVVAFSVVMGILLITYFSGLKLFFFDAYQLRSTYGFVIGSIFSGVIGVGFYPIFGSRVWCRFGCPMAAILGFQQRLFSKFRITTNGGQCISCGNCSTYCEMGIDVRAYAQKGENIVRSSCVGCGICSAVCPRGVLKLENDNRKGRINSKEVLLGNDVDLMNYVNSK
ncbi:MAG: FeS-binding protein [Cytophagaceae bacterium]|nr:FeS-binding protein [Cytophagaceae bacterium]